MIHLEAVPKAVSNACNKPYMNLNGFRRPMKNSMAGKDMHPWIINPTITVSMYMPSRFSSFSKSSIAAI